MAFLRGINVGGRVVKKEKLQEAFVSLGFQNVATYKQSGNVIFESNATNMEEIRSKIEEKLSQTLSYNVAVFIRTISQLMEIIDLQPFKNQECEGASFLVTLLPSQPAKFPLPLPCTIPKSTAQVISAKGYGGFQRHPRRRRRSIA